MDKFVENTTGTGCTPALQFFFDDPGVVMDYYDGNTVTALWNYAQNFAMSDNSYGTTFGPSTPGALNLISGQTHSTVTGQTETTAFDTVIDDPDPYYDDCSGSFTVKMSDGSNPNPNVGDLLNTKGVTWGWFEEGFKPTIPSDGTSKAVCGSKHDGLCQQGVTDYSAHHEPFQYYASTSNPHHLSPTSVSMIGFTDQANHQYDLSDFWDAVQNGNQPAVSFLKAAKYQDGHAGYSDPLDEQTFLVNTINALQKLPTWKNTAVIISYDDSDGWYDHQMGPILKQSNDPDNDALTDPGALWYA
jgi:phospholipase C